MTGVCASWSVDGLALTSRRLFLFSLLNDYLRDSAEFGADAQHSVDAALLSLLTKH